MYKVNQMIYDYELNIGDKLYFVVNSKQQLKEYDILTTTVKGIEEALSSQNYYIVDFDEYEEVLKITEQIGYNPVLSIVTDTLSYYTDKCEIDSEYKNNENPDLVRNHVFELTTKFFVNITDAVNHLIQRLKKDAMYYTNCLNDIHRNMLALTEDIANSNLFIYENNEYINTYKNHLNVDIHVINSEPLDPWNNNSCKAQLC